MDNIMIREHALKMAVEIQEVIDKYNKVDPAFSFVPVITVTETETSVARLKGISVVVEVGYSTQYDQQGNGSKRKFAQADTSNNAFVEGSLTPRESFKATIIGDRIKPYDV